MVKTNTETVLEVKNLAKDYESFSLNDISFKVKKGSITGFLGINGSGKTTTIKSLAGLTLPTSGEIYFFGEKIDSKNESRIKSKIAFLLDGNYYYPELKLKVMKKIFSRAYPNWDENVFNKLMQAFELNPNQKISTLSKGMKARFSLALALSHGAELIIMDEPTEGLDPLMRESFVCILKDLAQKGITIFLSSHITSDLDKIADEVILIHDGNIMLQEEMKNLKASYFAVSGDISMLSGDNEKMFLRISKDENEFTGTYRGNKDDILNQFPDAKIRSANLEEIMFGNIMKSGRRISKI